MTETSTVHIDVFTDYVCPWCYLSSANVTKLQENYPVSIQWTPFPLHPDTPEEGLLLTELFQGRDMTAAQAHLESLIKEAGLEYGYREKTFNTRLAQELGKWANTQENGEVIHNALYRAYFVDGKNLAEKDVLLDVVKAIGLNVDEATQVLETRSFGESVDKDWQRAKQYKITGVPSFISNNFVMSGCQPYEELERFVGFIQSKQAEQ